MFKRSCRGSIVVRHNSSVINFLWLLVSSENFVERDIFDYIFPVKSTDDAKIELNDVRYFEIFIISNFLTRFFWHNFLTNRVIVSLTKTLHFVSSFFLFQNVSFRANDTFVSSVLLSFFRVLLILLQLSRVSWFYFMRKIVHF